MAVFGHIPGSGVRNAEMPAKTGVDDLTSGCVPPLSHPSIARSPRIGIGVLAQGLYVHSNAMPVSGLL